MKEDIIFEEGSDNVFADLGLPDPKDSMVRAKLLRLIVDIIEHRDLKQKEVCALLGVKQPVVSDLQRGKLSKFSLDRLLKFMTALDRDITITVKKKPARRKRPAEITVAA